MSPRPIVVACALAVLAACGSQPPVGAPTTPTAPVAPPPPATALPTAAPAPPSLRLPPLARPLRYDLELWLDPRSVAFHGKVGIDLEILQPTSLVWLNATDLTIDAATLETPDGSQTARVLPGGSDFVGFAVDRPLAPGKARLSIAYRGAVDQERSRAIYAAREGDGEPYLYTFFEAIDARRAFPCFDEPSYKVPWKLSFHVPRGDVALANAPVTAERVEGDAKLVEIAESKPMPSYLVAFVVGPFDVIDAGTAGHAGTPLRFIVPRGRGGDTAYAASVTPKIVGALEDYFGMPYPFRKLDVAVVPRYWGTMEHPGIVALGQPLTLIAANDASLEREQHYTNIAAHELAHYWFGDYVTAAWWDDAWLNEALGTWMDATVTERVEPKWGFDLERIARAANGMRDDVLTSAKKIRQPVASKSDIESSFDSAITYYKGQSVLSMFEAWLTPPRFQRVIRAYVAEHAWKNATAEDFFRALDVEQPGAGDALKSFVDQPGLPSITFETQCTPRDEGDPHAGPRVTVAVHQHRYAPLGETAPAGTWKIPVCVRIPKQKGESDRACTLLSSESGTIPIDRQTCPSWVIGNADGIGYYATAYTKAQLRAAWSRSSGATPAERLALLHDAGALVTSGDLPLGDALAMARDTVSSKERQLVAAGLALVALAPGSAMTDAEAARSASFQRKTYGPRAAQLGLARRSDDDLDAQLMRSAIVEEVAVGGRDPALRERAHALAFTWLKDERAIPGELVNTVLEAAAKSNDEKLFAAILEKAKAEPDNFKRSRLLGALGSFTAPALVAQADALLTGTAFDVRDAFGILFSQFADRATLQAAWDFVKASFDVVSTRMRDDEVLFEYLRVVRHFCDETHQRDVAQFFASRASRFNGGPRALATAVEAIGRCSTTFQKNRASLDAFLAGY